MALHHPCDPERQRDGYDSRESFRDRSHRQTHRREKHRHRRDAAQGAKQEHNRDNAEGQPQQGVPQLLQSTLKRRFLLLGLGFSVNQRGNLPKLRLGSGGRHQRAPFPGDDNGPHEEHVMAVTQGHLCLWNRLG